MIPLVIEANPISKAGSCFSNTASNGCSRQHVQGKDYETLSSVVQQEILPCPMLQRQTA
jgi:hypothetical protein